MFGKVFSAIEGHVLDKVGQTLLVVIFENGAGFNHEPEFGSFFGFLVGTYVVAQSVVKLAHRDLWIDGHRLC